MGDRGPRRVFGYGHLDISTCILALNSNGPTTGNFEGWTVLKKQSFVAQFCSILSRHALLGVTVSAAKGE